MRYPSERRPHNNCLSGCYLTFAWLLRDAWLHSCEWRQRPLSCERVTSFYSLFAALRLHAGTRAFNVLFGLEFLILLLKVFVERLGEYQVYFLSQIDLSHLELAQVVRHHSVSEVGVYHLLQEDHVFAGELAEALVESPANLWVTPISAIDHLLDVVFAIVKVLNEFPEVFEHQLPVGQNLLVLH
jgi:hypothetical protein